MAVEQQRRHLPAVDMLRGVAILMVLYHHVFAPLTAPPHCSFITWNGISLAPAAILSNGWAGVNLFFMLSGFVLYLPFANGRRTFSVRADWAVFYSRRAKRLLPLLCLNLVVAMVFFVPPASVWQAVRDSLLIISGAFALIEKLWIPMYNNVLWSLGVEMWFSILFPLIVLAAMRWGLANVLRIGLPIALVARYGGQALREIFEPGQAVPFLHGTSALLCSNIIGRLDDFLIGMALVPICLAMKPGFSSKAWGWLAGGMASLVLASSLADAFTQSETWARHPLLYTLYQFAFVGLIIAAFHCNFGAPWLNRVTAPLRLSGKMSYSLYLWHYLPVALLFQSKPGPAEYVLYLAAVFGVSYLSAKYIERVIT